MSAVLVTEKPVVLFSEEQIERRIGELASQIAAAYAGEEVCVVGVMKNCLVFMADLIRALPGPMTCHMVRATQGGRGGSEIVYSAEAPYEDQHVLLLYDVVDTGITLTYLLDHIREHHPKSLRVCALIDKSAERKVELRPDWALFSLPEPFDRFLVGYGLGYAEHYRGLPYVGMLERPAPQAQGGKLHMSLGSEQ